MEILKAKLKSQVIQVLNLKHLAVEDIDDNQPLFGEGLGLDSIDALELVVLLQKEYNITIPNAGEGIKIFGSIQSMAEYITQQKNKV